ncbi:NUDIX hydrolase [Hathewaya massiliensis]|uniref:NUDIX hydrolase n=1 Tax=Hathewaya massiliensis TaxID=1964382 RepID=UPI00115A8AE8|nr:8-oxo-dGTP diphosphatase [Hathewaya massiliensis]
MKVATSCYITKDNKTLMLHRIKKKDDVHKGRWIGLGGKIEQGETPEDCVIREVKEESGLTLKNPILRGILTFPKFDKNEDWYVFLYTATEVEGELQECNEGVLQWIDNDKILDLNILEGDKLFLGWLKQYQMFSAKLVYDNGELIEHKLVVYD